MTIDDRKMNKNEPIQPAPGWARKAPTAAGAVVVTLLVLSAALLVVPYTGMTDVAADQAHSPLVGWFLETTQEHSVAVRAKEIESPADLDAPWRVDRGLLAYHDMCESCHGAPGVEPGWIARGLNPAPPRFADPSEQELAGRSPERSFWVIKNGIRMTGMAALAPTHGDEEIWNLAAFVEQMPDMTAAAYLSSLRSAGEESGADADRHGHGGVEPSTSGGGHSHGHEAEADPHEELSPAREESEEAGPEQGEGGETVS